MNIDRYFGFFSSIPKVWEEAQGAGFKEKLS
jgi:hypothetical protein